MCYTVPHSAWHDMTTFTFTLWYVRSALNPCFLSAIWYSSLYKGRLHGTSTFVGFSSLLLHKYYQFKTCTLQWVFNYKNHSVLINLQLWSNQGANMGSAQRLLEIFRRKQYWLYLVNESNMITKLFDTGFACDETL